MGFIIPWGRKIRLQMVKGSRWTTVVSGKLNKRTLLKMKEWLEKYGDSPFSIRLQYYIPPKYRGLRGKWIRFGASTHYGCVLLMLEAIENVGEKHGENKCV